MVDQLNDELLARLRERAQDPARRSGVAAMSAGSVSLGDALAGITPAPDRSAEHRAAVDDYLSGMNTPFAGMIADLASGDGRQAGGLLAALGSLTGGTQVFAMSGDLGTVSAAAVQFFRGPHFGGFRETMAYPLVVDMAIHHFDLMRFLLDRDPVAVSGRSWNPPWS